MWRWLCVATLLVLLPLVAAGAQVLPGEPPVPLGSRVRVTVSAPDVPRYVGTLAALSGDTLALRPEARLTRAPVAIPLASVRRLELSRGRGPCSGPGRRTTCLVVGGIAGIAAGAAVGYAVGGSSLPSRLSVGLLSVPIGFLGGLAVGGSVGGDRWAEVPLPRARRRNGRDASAGHLT